MYENKVHKSKNIQKIFMWFGVQIPMSTAHAQLLSNLLDLKDYKLLAPYAYETSYL